MSTSTTTDNGARWYAMNTVDGLSFAKIAAQEGVTRGVVAGQITRYRATLAVNTATVPENDLLSTPSQTAEFPDKRVPKRDYKSVTAQIREVQRYKNSTSVAQDEATWIPRPEYPDLPIALTWMSDVHYGALDTDYELLEKHLAIIHSTPNMYVAFGGDQIDNFNAIKYASAIWGNGVSPEDQMAGFADEMKQLDRVRKLAAIVWGNHDDFTIAAGVSVFSTFFRTASCPLFTHGGGVLNVKVGQQTYRLGLRHTFWGNSKLNVTNAPKRMIQFGYDNLDAAFVGHVHTAGGEQYTLAGRERIAVTGGTYKLFDVFHKNWVGEPDPGGFTIVLHPKTHSMELCRFPERAQNILLGNIALVDGDVLTQASAAA